MFTILFGFWVLGRGYWEEREMDIYIYIHIYIDI